MSARRTIAVLVVGLGFLDLPSSALAVATPVSVDNTSSTLMVSAANNETNNVTVSRDATHYIVSDTVAGVMTADAADCMPSGATIRCNAAVVTAISVTLGNLNDFGRIGASVPELGSSFDQNVQVTGGTGDDELTAEGDVNVVMNGDANMDKLTSAGGRDSLSGGDGPDTISSGGGFDSVFDNGGSDTVDAGAGDDNISTNFEPDGPDTFLGGDGIDGLQYSNRSVGVSITANDIADDGAPAEGDNVGSSIENYSGGSGDDSIGGTPGDNALNGGNGADIVSGEGGDDDISGNQGADTLSGGDGADELTGGEDGDSVSGGPGNDYIEEEFFDLATDVQSGGDGIDAIGGGGELPLLITLDGVADDGVTDPIISGGRDNVMPDVENAEGGEADDILIGNDSDNELTGGGGNDTLIGLGGADGLFGGNGADSLSGGPGIDTLSGAGGADTLRSRDEGPDEIDCGSSVDTLFADSFDDPSADCDAVSRGVRIAFKRASLSNGKVSLTASCPAIEPGGCAASFTLRAGGKVIARANKVLDPGENAKVKLKPTKAGRKALDGNGSLGATATATMTDSAGDVVSSERKLRVQL